MKKIIAVLMCAIMMMCALTTVVLAEEETIETVVQAPPVTEPVVDTDSLQTKAEQIIAYGRANFEEIFVVVTSILAAFYQVRKHKLLNKSIVTLNNNAVTISENSKNAMQDALGEMGGVATVVTEYKTDIEALLEEYRATAEEKKKLEQTLDEVHNHLKTAKLANVELANEVAELLVLANIPNAKKDELYSRHLAAVGAIADAEQTEVIPDVNGQEEE